MITSGEAVSNIHWADGGVHGVFVFCICNDASQVYGGQAATNERQDEGSAEKDAPGGKVIIMTTII